MWIALLLACGPTSRDNEVPAPPSAPDADGDRITDSDEGASALIDTDRDGTPDYLDRDSDEDGIADSIEAGDVDVDTAPFDSDQDGIKDFRDLDSDGNERDDEIEGVDDPDQDGRGNFADVDDDGDGIYDSDELGPNPSVAVDSDGDGVGDFHDLDSDGDGIGDAFETAADFDRDGSANFRDLDSDGDCRADRVEYGGPPPRDSDLDRRYDFLDRDSDNDGVSDRNEDRNCDGRHDLDESDATKADTDGDGIDDLIETEAGSNPNNPADNPRARGDFVFVLPYQQPQRPRSDNLNFRPQLANVDMYVVVDRSASMASETASIKDRLGAIIRDLQCPPTGTGNPSTCIPNLYAGLGGIGYRTDQPFVNYLPVQANPNISGTTISNVAGVNTVEPLVFGVWTSITNFGSALASSQYGCALNPVLPNSNCPAGGYGQACFRPGSLPVIVLATDEPPLLPLDTYDCPAWNGVTREAMNARSAKLVGIYGSGSTSTTISNLATMANETGAVDVTQGGQPLVFNGADAGAATAIGDGIRALARGVPLDMAAVAVDTSGDAIDAVTAFVDHLETLQLGDAVCASGLLARDSNADSFLDEFVDISVGTPLCWKLVTKPNLTVPQLERPQLFRARVDVVGDGITVVDSRDIFFLVPPQAFDDPVE